MWRCFNSTNRLTQTEESFFPLKLFSIFSIPLSYGFAPTLLTNKLLLFYNCSPTLCLHEKHIFFVLWLCDESWRARNNYEVDSSKCFMNLLWFRISSILRVKVTQWFTTANTFDRRKWLRLHETITPISAKALRVCVCYTLSVGIGKMFAISFFTSSADLTTFSFSLVLIHSK